VDPRSSTSSRAVIVMVAPRSADLQSVLHTNIQALVDHRREQEKRQALQDRIAGLISRFAGSMAFVYLHFAIQRQRMMNCASSPRMLILKR
jgi:uncharacterized membrane protein